MEREERDLKRVIYGEESIETDKKSALLRNI